MDERPYSVDSVERVFDDFFAVDRATVKFGQVDGSMSEHHFRVSVERGDSVGMLVRDVGADEFIFVRQFRYPCVRHGDAWLLEAPAGKIEDGESPEVAAMRELSEEIGYDVPSIHRIGAFYGSPGGLSELTTLFYGEVSCADRTSSGGGVDPGEDVEIVRIACATAVRQALAGEIRDGKALIALLWYATSFPSGRPRGPE